MKDVTKHHIERIMSYKNISEQEAILLVLDNYAERQANSLEKIDRVIKNISNHRQEENRVLLITEDKFEKMKNFFIECTYASADPTKMSRDVRFSEFRGVKDVILRNEGFHLLIFNDYDKKESTLVTYMKIGYDEVGREEFKFNSIEDFYLKVSQYKKYLNEDNGTIQVIDYLMSEI